MDPYEAAAQFRYVRWHKNDEKFFGEYRKKHTNSYATAEEAARSVDRCVWLVAKVSNLVCPTHACTWGIHALPTPSHPVLLLLLLLLAATSTRSRAPAHRPTSPSATRSAWSWMGSHWSRSVCVCAGGVRGMQPAAATAAVVAAYTMSRTAGQVPDRSVEQQSRESGAVNSIRDVHITTLCRNVATIDELTLEQVLGGKDVGCSQIML